MKQLVTLDKLLYAGFLILMFTKLHTQKFHYDYVRRTHGKKVMLLFTDIYTFTYYIETTDIYVDMGIHQDLFHNSVYHQSDTLYSTKYKTKIDCFKVKLNSKTVYEFVRPRAKT